MSLHTILAPLDGSAMSERALPIATTLAQTAGAHLVLVRAAWAHARPGADRAEAQMHAVDEAETYLAGVAARLAEQGLQPEVAIPYAPAAEGILIEADIHKADLVVMCTHGRSGLGRWVYGSVAEAVLTASRAPVLLVRATGAAETIANEWGRTRLLVPLDGSPFAETALALAEDLARTVDATLVLLRVVPPVHIPAPTSELMLARTLIVEDVVREEQAQAETYIDGVAERLRKTGLRVQTVVRLGVPADVILAEAQTAGARLVVMATHGRTGLRRLVFGSVAAEVLHRGSLPLLLVRPEDMIAANAVNGDAALAAVGGRFSKEIYG